MFKPGKSIKAIRWNNLNLLVFAVGIILPCIQYIFNRSLWLDEATLSLNIVGKSALELLHPLDYLQVAPVLFLEISKLFYMLLPGLIMMAN